MGNLSSLLLEIKAGTIPEGTLYKRKSSTRRSPKRKNQIRIAPVDAALTEVKEGLEKTGEYKISGSPKKVTLTPDQYKEAIRPFEPHLETLDEAQVIVSALKRGRISYDGHKVDLPYKPWPKHRRAPHMERILALKRQLYSAIQLAERGYQRWQSKNQQMKTEISNEISQLEKSASATKRDYDILVRTYEALQSSMATPNDNWYVAAAQTLGCDGRLDVILNKLEQSETSLRTSVVRVKRGFEAIRQTLELQIKALDTGDYILTSEDIEPESEKGLQGRLGESLTQIEWYTEPKRALFEGGVTPASPQKSGMIKALRAVMAIEGIINKATTFKSQHERLVDDFSQAHFLGIYDLDFNADAEKERVETAFADIKLYGKLKQHYLGKFDGFDELKTRAQQAYDTGCDKLRKESAKYLGIARVELEEVETTKKGIENLCKQIEAARQCSYRGISATEVINEERLTQLKGFRDVLIRAQTRLDSTPPPREMYSRDGELRIFDNYYESARMNREWGVYDSQFKSAVGYARHYANQILTRVSPQTKQAPIDSRVDHLLQQQVRTSPIPDGKLKQLEAWEAEIQATY